MWRYLKAAFWARADVPALGRVPFNVLGVTAFSILGFADPGFWLLGAGLETAYLFTLGLNPRFQKVVEARSFGGPHDEVEGRRRTLERNLAPALQKRLTDMGQRCGKVIEVFHNQQAEDFVIDASREALERLEWVYLKLLVARQNLQTVGSAETGKLLSGQAAAIEEELRQGGLSESLRNSKTATLATIRERLANFQRKEQSLEEIDSDLARIESQVDLILERATLQGKPQTISTDIDLASNLVGGALFGESESTVADLDQTYGQPARAAEKPRHEAD